MSNPALLSKNLARHFTILILPKITKPGGGWWFIYLYILSLALNGHLSTSCGQILSSSGGRCMYNEYILLTMNSSITYSTY